MLLCRHMSEKLDNSDEDVRGKREVDPYRAYRELERWLFNGISEDDRVHRRTSIDLAKASLVLVLSEDDEGKPAYTLRERPEDNDFQDID